MIPPSKEPSGQGYSLAMNTNSPWMPSFSKSHAKYMARELHIGFLYRFLSGNLIIPDGKGYWYLCNEQSDSEGSEIYQLTKKPRKWEGNTYFFARPEQCYGVDRSVSIIKKNKRLHQNSNWIAAEWNAAIQDQSLFDPALVYLDTTSFADRQPAVTALKETLRRCKKNTLVVANVMMSNARAGEGDNYFDKDALIDNLFEGEHAETFAAWNVSPYDLEESLFHSYEYQTSKTLMRSYIFFKGTLPPTEVMMEEFGRFKKWCSFSSLAKEMA